MKENKIKIKEWKKRKWMNELRKRKKGEEEMIKEQEERRKWQEKKVKKENKKNLSHLKRKEMK